MTVLSVDDDDKKITISIMKDGLDTKNKIIAPKCDTDEPSDVDMADEKPDAKPMTKGKY